LSDAKVEKVPAEDLAATLNFLEETLRDHEPLPAAFVAELRASVARGETDVFVARSANEVVGVAVVNHRLNISAGGRFASIEEFQVRPEAREKGMGRALLRAVTESCASRGISYIEVQTDDEATGFYTSCRFEAEPEVRVMSVSTVLGNPQAMQPVIKKLKRW